MASSDIYEVKENPWAKKPAGAVSQRRRQRRRGKSFDETVNPDMRNTHQRRSRNSGFRRLRHRLKDPAFSKKFWTLTLGAVGLILALLILWDRFFRYPKQPAEYTPGAYRTSVE